MLIMELSKVDGTQHRDQFPELLIASQIHEEQNENEPEGRSKMD
jgi:hypothetical protein